MNGIIEQARERHLAKLPTATAGYRRLVAMVAADGEPHADELIAAIESAGKTVDDFAADVERLLSRKRLAESLSNRGEHEADRDRAVSEIATATKEFESLTEQHNARMATLTAARDAACEALATIDAAERELIFKASDPALLAERKRLWQAQNELCDRRIAVVQELTSTGPLLAELEAVATVDDLDDDEEAERQQLAAKMDALRGELLHLDGEFGLIAKAVKAVADFEREKLTAAEA